MSTLLSLTTSISFFVVASVYGSHAMEMENEVFPNKVALKKAAAQGDVIAQDNLGELYIKEKNMIKP
ncbi:hypothetical protein [Candidatus Paracaedibacter symbiosus]|uniref:hypothetical protein n=1 Tax=Candidatus Paracaedibacter symbiosus TaxID=244582 RepID=UPI00068D80E0|nr:hypothetical protein [Candidatus Paracaedibacter symbiosus]